MVKKIAVLTSGGDAPGMNAAVRAVVRTTLNAGIEVYGVVRGFNGLINDELIPLNLRSVCNILQQGGTMLYTARCLEFKNWNISKRPPRYAASTASTAW